MRILLFTVLFFLIVPGSLLFCQSARVERIEVEHNRENRVYFRVYNMVVHSMKGRKIHTEFWLSRNGSWIPSSRVRLDPVVVLHDPSYFNGEAYWFWYNYDDFATYGDPYQSFWGSFFVYDYDTEALLLQKDIEFSLPDSVLGGSFRGKDIPGSLLTDTGEGYQVDHSWCYRRRYYSSGFYVDKADHDRSARERDAFVPLRGSAEDNGDYITLWDMDFNEFYSDLYGFLYSRNADRLASVKETLLHFRDTYNLGYAEFAGFVLNCVQYTSYVLPEKLYGIYTPLEVIASLTGDCDSRSVLLYTLLKDFGYEVCIFYSDYYVHAMLGIAYVGAGDYMSRGGIKYYFTETTATGWEIGDLPPEWSDKSKWSVLFPVLR